MQQRWRSLFLQLAVANASFQQTCMSFDPIAYLTNATIRVHEYVPANTTIQLPGMDPTCGRTKQLIPIDACRVALTIATSNRSSFIFEMFFPSEGTGRLLATGNGGIDGCIKYEDMVYALDHGFAVTGTNNGHNGTGGEAFLNNPDVIEDFSFRALHTGTGVGKKLLKAFYGTSQYKSYYLGCSGGGRQGVQAASLFPDDYDGILVGAPALNFNYMSAWRASFYTITKAANSSGFIAAGTWQGLIHQEVLRQCDDLDGANDGILADPSLCAAVFRPETLLCGRENTTGCLTAQQVEVVRKVFSPLYGVDGKLIYSSLSPGAEVQATQRLLSGTPFSYSVDWYRYAVYSNPAWNPASWTIQDAAAAEEANPGNARTWPSDLSPFRDAGGKLILYHGGADQQITPFDTERWYNYMSAQMGATSKDLDTFMRFFRIPGMGHCSGGVGAWQVGQNRAGAQGTPYEPKTNALAALVNWVETDTAPDTLLGTKFVNDTITNGVALSRRHCRYPLLSTYVGGETASAASWSCK
ncbi:tannase and feruloyl esterase, partial [Polyplosphaeria fusca]